MSFAPLISALVTGAGIFKSGSDAKKAAEKNADIAIADAMHRKEVSEYNASILTDQAKRLRNEQVARLNEVAGINTGRITEDMEINIGRINEAYGINVSRLLKSSTTEINRVLEDSLIKSARIQEKADTTVRRLERDAATQVQIGSEEENKIRRIAAETISSTRAFYGARNIVIDSGTPAALQIDAARMGEVDALRMRRNYRLKAQSILEQAADVKRDALWEVGDVNRVAAYQLQDLREAAGNQLTDLTREMQYTTSDINRVGNQQLSDINRNLGYDLSDNEFEATKLDQQAALTILQGDAALSAGINRSEAYKDAGANAFTQGILGAVGAVIPQINPKWLTSNSSANVPIVTSQPTYVRS